MYDIVMHPPQDSELPRGGLVVVNGHKEKNGHLYTWGVRSSWVHPELEKKNWILLFLNIQAGLLFEYLNQISLWTSSFFEQTSFWASNNTSSWTSIQTGLLCEHPNFLFFNIKWNFFVNIQTSFFEHQMTLLFEPDFFVNIQVSLFEKETSVF